MLVVECVDVRHDDRVYEGDRWRMVKLGRPNEFVEIATMLGRH